jgi:peptide/nickel transport system substrate-binding protein
MIRRTRLRRLTPWAVALVAGLSACTPAAEPTSTVTAGPTTTVPPTSTTIPPPFVYRIGMTRDVTTLNPWAAEDTAFTSRWTSYVLDQTRASLFAPRPDSAAVQPLLAAGDIAEPVEQGDGSWAVEVAVVGTWSDGTPVTPGDVVFTFDTVRRLELGGQWRRTWFPDAVTAVTAAEGSVRIQFASRPGLEVWPFGPGTAPILPAHHWADLVEGIGTAEALYALDAAGAPSAGRFVVVDRTEGEEIRLEPNPEWDGEQPAVEEAVYAVYPDVEAAVDALVTGEIDVIIDPDGLAPEAVTETGLDEAELGSMVSENNGFRFLAFNLNRPVTGNLGFRQAVDLIATAHGSAAEAGGEFEAGVSIPSANLAWFDPEVASRLRTEAPTGPADRLERLVAALSGAGFAWTTPPALSGDTITPGTGLTLSGAAVPALEVLSPAEDQVRLGFAKAVVSGLAELGFTVSLTEATLDEVVERVFTPTADGFDFDMYLAGWTLGRPEFPSHHSAFFGTPSESRGLNNNTGFTSGAFDELLATYSATRDLVEARQVLWAMEEILATQKPYVFLYTEPITELYRADRVAFPFQTRLGGIQADGGALALVEPLE